MNAAEKRKETWSWSRISVNTEKLSKPRIEPRTSVFVGDHSTPITPPQQPTTSTIVLIIYISNISKKSISQRQQRPRQTILISDQVGEDRCRGLVREVFGLRVRASGDRRRQRGPRVPEPDQEVKRQKLEHRLDPWPEDCHRWKVRIFQEIKNWLRLIILSEALSASNFFIIPKQWIIISAFCLTDVTARNFPLPFEVRSADWATASSWLDWFRYSTLVGTNVNRTNLIWLLSSKSNAPSARRWMSWIYHVEFGLWYFI